MHYKRIRNHGSLQVVRERRPDGVSVVDWFWQHVKRSENCWIWTGAILARRGGYGSFWDGTRKLRAHHFLVGRPPAGMEWHHTCENILCVRPEHLKLLGKSAHRKIHRQH